MFGSNQDAEEVRLLFSISVDSVVLVADLLEMCAGVRSCCPADNLGEYLAKAEDRMETKCMQAVLGTWFQSVREISFEFGMHERINNIARNT